MHYVMPFIFRRMALLMAMTAAFEFHIYSIRYKFATIYMSDLRMYKIRRMQNVHLFLHINLFSILLH